MEAIVRLPEDRPAVALETTLLVHGVPREHAINLHRELGEIITAEHAHPALVGVVEGRPTVGMTDDDLAAMLERGSSVPKANTANLGVLMHWGAFAATTVSATMELASRAGMRVFATGGLGGVHKGYGCNLDVSSDLSAFTRFPVATVASGVKSILDVTATREALETLGVTVVGFRTDRFPAFFLRESEAEVDARFDEVDALAAFVDRELSRSQRGLVVCNPVPEGDALHEAEFDDWLEQAEDEAEDAGVAGRAVTPFVLERLHSLSQGATLRANLALVKSNARLAAQLAHAMLEAAKR